MEYLCECVNKIISIAPMLDEVSISIGIIIQIVTGVVMIMGIRYLKPLQEKTISATFTFWSQLRVRLMGINEWLKSNYGLLDNMYSPESKKGWENLLTPSGDRIEAFKKCIDNVLQYMESTEDQMPAYIGWSNDYSKLITYFREMMVYDICDNSQYFKFREEKTTTQRREYVESICNTIEKICSGIDAKQKNIETKLLKKKEK